MFLDTIKKEQEGRGVGKKEETYTLICDSFLLFKFLHAMHPMAKLLGLSLHMLLK